MGDKLKPYPKYQVINLPWLNTIPNHWSLLRNKNFLFEEKDVVGEESNSFKLLSLTKQGVIYRDIESGKGKFPKEFNTYKIVKNDNLILCLFDIDETPRTVGLSKHEGMITGAYDVFSIKNAIPKYIFYYYLSIDNVKGLKPLYTGLRKVVRPPVFLRSKFPLPPLQEQIQIANFLDSKVALVNKFIKDKKNEILLLKEQKQAEKNHAITQGINPNVRLKKSGIEWIGNIPFHWEVEHLRGLLRMKSIKNMAHLPLLSVVREKGVIMRDLINDKNHNFVPDDLSGYKSVKKGDFVINKMKAWQGSCGVSNFDGIVSPAYYTFELDFENKDYFNLAIRSKVYVNFFTQFSGGIRVGQWDLSSQKLKSIPFFIPPPEEQIQIEEYLRIKEEQINRAISAIEKEITLIQDYKTSLISDVVTGKVDVRNVAVEKIDIELEEEIEEIEETEDLVNSEE